MFDYEWAALQHHVNCRLANRVLVPDAIPAERLARYGARPPKLVQYPGLKEEYYLADFEPDPAVLEQLGVERARLARVVRTAPSYALYLGGSENPLLPRLLRARSRRRGRADRRARAHRRAAPPPSSALGLGRVIVPARAVDGRSLVAFADLLVSAGGHDEPRGGRPGHARCGRSSRAGSGAVDEQLSREGRLRILARPGRARPSSGSPRRRLARTGSARPRRAAAARAALGRSRLSTPPAGMRLPSAGAEHALDRFLVILLGLAPLAAQNLQVAGLEDLERVDHPDRGGDDDEPDADGRSACCRGPSGRTGRGGTKRSEDGVGRRAARPTRAGRRPCCRCEKPIRMNRW